MNKKDFEKLLSKKIRFSVNVPGLSGNIASEDLYDLDNTQLVQILKKLNRQVEDITEYDSFIKQSNNERILNLKIKFVKYILETRIQEREETQKQAENRRKKQEYLEILEEKQKSKLRKLSIKELQKMIGEL